MAAKAKKQKKGGGGALGRVIFAILVTLAVLALGFFLVMRDQGDTILAENAVGSVFSPIQNAVNSATRYIRDVVTGVKDYFFVTAAYEDAQQEINSLKIQLAALEEASIENERLTDLLDARDQYDTMDPVYARVIARDPGVWFDTFSINRGTKDGVLINMAVITGDGLVGRVYEAGLNYAKVLSVIDPRSSVACLIERTRNGGVMRGQTAADSDTSECFMYYLPAVNDIVPGDIVLTSGEDTRFPKGIPVGTVASVSRQSDLSDQYIVVLPFVDFLTIEEVLVLRTVVETDKEALPILPTPTPRPTPTPMITPKPTGDALPDIPAEDQPWSYPTPLPEGMEPGMTPDPKAKPSMSPSPSPSFNPDTMLPEDAWAL